MPGGCWPGASAVLITRRVRFRRRRGDDAGAGPAHAPPETELMNANDRDAKLREIRDKVEAEERLSLEDGIFLYDPQVPMQAVGELANWVRERKNGNVGYFNINTHLNPTNVCVYRCRFCAFRSDLRDPKGYVMSDQQILDRGREATENGCTEMHIVGGLHHQKPYSWYRRIIELLHEHYPQIHLKGWTAVEINWFEFQTKKSVRWVLEDLKAAGLGSMPGGGAEIFHPQVRDQLCEHKANTRAWLDIHRTAHEIGLRTNCTMLYGHVENALHRIDHLIRLRDLQDETGGFQVFIPLGVSSRKHQAVADQKAVSSDGFADHGGQPSDARQRPTHQGLLDHAGGRNGANRTCLRCRRPRRHRASRIDLSRRRSHHAAVPDGRQDP